MSEELSEEEVMKMVKHLKALGVKPKVDSLEDFKASLSEHPALKAEVKYEQPFTPTSFTNVSTSVHHFPKISHFSGDQSKDAHYDVWKHEVECLIGEGHSTQTIAQSIRSSLRGEALHVHSHLGAKVTIGQVLAKVDSLYGTVESPETMLAKFYSARQGESEDVTTWSCRLEDLLVKAIEAGATTVDPSQHERMLCTIFYGGLRPSLKDVTGHIYEREHEFDSLRIAVRRVEEDKKQRTSDVQKKPATPAPAKSLTTVEEHSELGELKKMVQQLAADMKVLKDQQQCQSGSQRFDLPYRQGQGYRGRSSIPQQPGNVRSSFQPRMPQPDQNATNLFSQQGTDSHHAPTCFRCGQQGHVQVGCRVILDHVRRPGNFGRPARRGRR